MKTRLLDFWRSFSFIGLAVAIVFFAASLTPSLLPRNFWVQGIESGVSLALGYLVGVLFVEFWLYLELPKPGVKLEWWSKLVTAVMTSMIAVLFLWRSTVWQNSIRERMEMDLVSTAYPHWVALIAISTAVVLLLLARGVGLFWRFLNFRMRRVMPPRVANFISTASVVVVLFMLVNNVALSMALNFADGVFLKLDQVVLENSEQPEDPLRCGSPESLVRWESIGRQGKNFLSFGPTRDSISEVLGGEAKEPIRVYVGLNSADEVSERAELALAELKRVGGFERSILVVATPTGTGWLDPGGVDTIEALHAGDTAIVSMQYSYLPSWITILVDPARSQASAEALFGSIYSYWKTLPRTSRPKLYVHGLSLGALGSAASADIYTIFEDPIEGGLWSGPPFPSQAWNRIVRFRNPDSPMWLPTYRDGSLLRFAGREVDLSIPSGGGSDKRWGAMRFVYLQHASDPMSFFSPSLLYRRPDWLNGNRGPDVSPHLRWYPLVTFLQIAFDLPLATSVPHGYGHNFSPLSYLDCWNEITQPDQLGQGQLERLREHFRASSTDSK